MIAASVLERSLNHLLRQTPGASDLLKRHAGASLRFDLGVQTLDYRLADDGYFSEAAVEVPDVTACPTPAFAVQFLISGREALRHVDYRGDPALLATLDRVFRQLTWDVEADLAPWVGDMAAHRLRTLGQTVRKRFAGAMDALGRNTSEYAVEEADMMARGIDVTRFNHEVDTLAEAAARLEARLRRLET